MAVALSWKKIDAQWKSDNISENRKACPVRFIKFFTLTEYPVVVNGIIDIPWKKVNIDGIPGSDILCLCNPHAPKKQEQKQNLFEEIQGI